MTNIAPLHTMTLAEARAKAEAINYDPDWTTEELIAATAHLSAAEKAELGTALRMVCIAMQQEAQALEAEGVARTNGLANAYARLEAINYRHDWTSQEFRNATAHLNNDDLDQLAADLETVAGAIDQEAAEMKAYVAHRSATA